nr:hypothetical protein [Coxiella burnetii]
MRMSEAEYGKTMMSSIVPVFRFASYGLLSCWASQAQPNLQVPLTE